MGSLQGITNQTSMSNTPASGILGGIGTLLGGPVGGLVGSLASSLFSNRGAMRRQRLADQQNIRFWKMQNEYNLPKNQITYSLPVILVMCVLYTMLSWVSTLFCGKKACFLTVFCG